MVLLCSFLFLGLGLGPHVEELPLGNLPLLKGITVGLMLPFDSCFRTGDLCPAGRPL